MVRPPPWRLIVFGAAMAAWWLVIIGFGLGALALCGWIYEYYVRGARALSSVPTSGT